MTTLPQTTTLRLPRPPAGTQLNISSGQSPALGMLPPASGAVQMTGGDIWRVLRANFGLIVLLLVGSAVAGYFLNNWLARYYPKYTASATVTISDPPQLDPLQQQHTDMAGVLLEQKTDVHRLKTPQLFSQVLQDEKSPIRQTNWVHQFPNMEAAKKDLTDNLIVTPQAETRLIKLEMSYRDPNDCKLIIKAIVDQAIADLENQNKDAQQKRSVNLTALKDHLDALHDELSGELASEQTKLNITNNSGSAAMSLKQTELGQWTTIQMGTDTNALAAQEKLASLSAQIAGDQDPPAITDMINRDPEVARDQAYLQNIDLELFADGETMGKESDSIKKLNAEKAMFTSKLEKRKIELRASARVELMDEARRERDGAKAAQDRVARQIASLEGEISSLVKEFGDYNTNSAALAVIDARRKACDEQITQIANYTAQKDLASLTWESLPEASEMTFPQLKVTMFAAILIGLGLGLSIAFARELMDTTVRSPRDITRVGNMTLLGMIPHEDDDPQCQGARLPLVIFEAPQSMMAEQLRQVRTRLQHAASLDTTRSILITSPSPDDGKSTIAANLASGLALNGRRILLVDANFRRPSLHRTFNLANDHGFSDVLNSLDLFESAVQETQVPNLYVLPSGLKPTNATELLESQLLMDFIERSLEEFDHVIFDSGPLLFVSETVALAPRVDGVVTVVRARTNTRGVLQRMRDSLRQIKAEHLGVVLNAVRHQGGGYYRSNIRTYYDYQNGDRAA